MNLIIGIRVDATSYITATSQILDWARSDVLSLIQSARLLILPSEWEEGFPVTVIEAFACGLLVTGSNLGSIAEIVRDGYIGLHFAAGDSPGLGVAVHGVLEHPQERMCMGKNTRRSMQKNIRQRKTLRC